MAEHIVFSSKQNTWISVTVPKVLSLDNESLYATLFTHLVDNGYLEQRASQIAEAAVLKHQYPGLQYDRRLENDVKMYN